MTRTKLGEDVGALVQDVARVRIQVDPINTDFASSQHVKGLACGEYKREVKRRTPKATCQTCSVLAIVQDANTAANKGSNPSESKDEGSELAHIIGVAAGPNLKQVQRSEDDGARDVNEH